MAGVTIEVGPNDTLSAAAELLAENDVGALLVTAGGQPRGIVTERDLVRAMAEGADLGDERVADRMSVQVEHVAPDAPIEMATARMLEGGIRHLPVIDGERLVGMVSMRDLLAAYASFPDR
jgi:CBS domain-containing protein